MQAILRLFTKCMRRDAFNVNEAKREATLGDAPHRSASSANSPLEPKDVAFPLPHVIQGGRPSIRKVVAVAVAFQ